uniref:DUF834 domain-containing protein n=1 Tax=Oryza meridionalis TaxID=40149 RepID=A0A0E0E9P6_9ORYZ
MAEVALTSSMTSSPEVARDPMVAGDLGHGDANRGHQKKKYDEGNSPRGDTTMNNDPGANLVLGLVGAQALSPSTRS